MKSLFSLLGLVVIAVLIVVFYMTLLGCCRTVSAGDRPEAYIYQAFKSNECFVCHGTQDLEWAHSFPYSMSTGTMEYMKISPTNGITLCRKDHERIGHYGNFSRYWNAELIPIATRLRDARRELK